MSKTDDTIGSLLTIVADLMRGERHSRSTIAARTGKSLPTADRWIADIIKTLPLVGTLRDGRTLWIALPEYRARVEKQQKQLERWVFPSLVMRSTRSA